MEVQVLSCAHKIKKPGTDVSGDFYFCAGEDLNGGEDIIPGHKDIDGLCGTSLYFAIAILPD